jgi:hypothetical protein
VVLSNSDPTQTLVPQGVVSGYSVHAPAPSQRPVVPQVDGLCAGHAGSGSPAGTKRQRPADPVWLQERQDPLQATLQHTPSEQCPEAQSPSLMQPELLSLRPQLSAVHSCPFEHWEVVVQLPSHRLVAESQE